MPPKKISVEQETSIRTKTVENKNVTTIPKPSSTNTETAVKLKQKTASVPEKVSPNKSKKMISVKQESISENRTKILVKNEDTTTAIPGPSINNKAAPTKDNSLDHPLSKGVYLKEIETKNLISTTKLLNNLQLNHASDVYDEYDDTDEIIGADDFIDDDADEIIGADDFIDDDADEIIGADNFIDDDTDEIIGADDFIDVNAYEIIGVDDFIDNDFDINDDVDLLFDDAAINYDDHIVFDDSDIIYEDGNVFDDEY